MTANLWIVIVLAGVISLLSPFVWRLLLVRVGALDVPNQRSSHSRPTLRGGGIAPLVSLLVGGLIAAVLTSDGTRLNVLAIITTAALVGLLGLVEDISGLPVKVRAGAQLLIGFIYSITISWFTDSHWLWIPLAAIYFTANVNFTNFMDGINGISSFHGLIAGLAFAWIGYSEEHTWLTFLGLLTATAFATFLPWNLIPPGMFLGDAGSYLLGGVNAAMVIAALCAGINPIMALAPLSIYWIDSVITLIKRIFRREPIFEAHRTHIYQQLTDHGISHIAAALIVAAFTAWASLAGFATSAGDLSAFAVALIGLALIWSIYLALPTLISRRKVLTT